MIVYRYQPLLGRASNLRFEPDDYVLQAQEKTFAGDRLPPINTLHSAEFRQKLKRRRDRDLAIKKKTLKVTVQQLKTDAEWNGNWEDPPATQEIAP